MIVSFFESIRYVGHLFPAAFLRIYIGYYFLNNSLVKFQGDFLTRPRLAATLGEWLPGSFSPDWYRSLIESFVIPNWQIFSYLLASSELVIGVSFLLGYMVRPVSVLGVFLSFNFILIGATMQQDFYKIAIAVFITLGWLGAGRCLGLDYYFFKKKRGIWW